MTDTMQTADAPAGAAAFVPDLESGASKLDDLWPSLVIPKEDIDAEIEKLSAIDRPSDGRRRSLIVHPSSIRGRGAGLAPGIQVALEVLLPGEASTPVRHNSAQVVFCIAGAGSVVIEREPRVFTTFDVWNTPSMATYHHLNDTSERQVRLIYSNAALLEKMNIHYVEESPEAGLPETLEKDDENTPSPLERDTFPIESPGAWLMSYERLVNPPVQHSPALFWPWAQVKPELDKLHALGPSYRGRRLYLLYNPATGRTNGTTHNFFATMTIRPGGIVDRPHRHTAAAINYYFKGTGQSVVGGKIYPWKAGDLMLSAPGWAVHNHASGDGDVYELTVQDSPLNLSMDSLLWQENLKEPPILIGSHSGWSTNRSGL